MLFRGKYIVTEFVGYAQKIKKKVLQLILGLQGSRRVYLEGNIN